MKRSSSSGNVAHAPVEAGRNGARHSVGHSIHLLDSSRIAIDPALLGGKPHVRGTRLSVEFVIGLMADGWSEAEILADYPGITHDDLIACLAYARDTLSSEKVFPSAA